jgi:hypothetical protein
LFPQRGIEALNVVRIPFDRISLNNDKEIRLFFILTSTDLAPKYAQEVQDSFFVRHSYPRRSFFDSGNLLSALLNASIFANHHFFDFLCQSGMKLLRVGRFADGRSQLALFPEVQTVVIMAVVDEKVDDVEWLSNFVTEGFCDSVLQNIIRRIMNDFNVLQLVQGKASRIGQFVDLRTVSFPRVFARTNESVSNFLAVPTFSLSDHDRRMDLEFDQATHLLEDVVRCLELSDRNRQEEAMTDFEFCLLDLTSNGLLPELLVDLYSLVFLQKKGKYLCGLRTAHLFMTKLMPFVTDSGLFSVRLKQAIDRQAWTSVLPPGTCCVTCDCRSVPEPRRI